MIKDELTIRLTSSLWFAILSYSFTQLPIFNTIPYQLPIFTAILLVLYGFYYGYKTFLLPADKLLTFPARCVAAIWSLDLSALILAGKTSYGETFVFTCALIAALLGWIYLYKIFLLPNVTYSNNHPSNKQRLLCMIIFGFSGSFIGLAIFKFTIMTLFILSLSSYLGFTYGHLILLLPSSFKAAIKSIMIGYIGGAYALLITLPIVFHGFALITFPVISIIIVAVPSITVTLLMYLFSRFKLSKG